MAEDWKLCLDWLVRCQVLPENHNAKQSTAQVFDLAQSLRDGVLICHLLNRLWPGVLPPKDFSHRPQMSQFLCQKNIKTFLQVCKSKFGLKDADLFTIPDLFEIKDFGKVVETLSKLSRCQVAQRLNVPGFSLKQSNVNNSQDEIYGDLPALANDQDVTDEYYDSVYTDGGDEEIYEDVMNVQKKYSADRPFTIEPKSKREHCLKELYETERNYVEALNMIIKHFIVPLKTKLDQRSMKIIFKGIEELYDCHKNFLADLHRAVVGHTVGSVQLSIADCFIKSKESFLIYGDFCSHLPLAQEQVDQVCLDPIIRDAVLECQRKANEGKFRLRDLLSVPMQRVLKYHLLIHELIKHTDPTHPDKKSLPVALTEMQDLSSYINEVKRDNEMNQNLQKIQESITDLQMPEGTSLIDYGRLQKDGELRVKSPDDNRFKTRYVFLFDRVILMCKSLGIEAGYSYKFALILSQYRIDEGKKLRDGNAFSLVENGEKNMYTFSAATADLKQKWIDSVKMAMENVSPPGAKGAKHEFVMSCFTSASICDVCKKLLRGIFYQGYKCTKLDCNMKVHKECILKAKDLDAVEEDMWFERSSRSRVKGVPAPDQLPSRPPLIRSTSAFQVPAPAIPSRTAIGKCKARFSYSGKPPPENGRSVINFEVNDVVELLNDDDPNWWEGRINGYQGFFPSSYVDKTRGMHNKMGTSYEETEKVLMRQAKVAGHRHTIASSTIDRNSSYVDDANGAVDNLPQCQWFVGAMGRDEAQKLLDAMRPGTYLVRESVAGTRQGEYALSLRSGTGVHHIKINKSREGKYYVAECRHFYTITELVEYYQYNSLKHSFPELDMMLTAAYKDVKRARGGESGGVILGYCVAQYDYAANQSQMLSLHAGDRIAILNKGAGGWWKGDLSGKRGYFPCTYVLED